MFKPCPQNLPVLPLRRKTLGTAKNTIVAERLKSLLLTLAGSLWLGAVLLSSGALCEAAATEPAKSTGTSKIPQSRTVSVDYDIRPTKVIQMQDGSYLVTGYFFDDTGPSSWGWVAKKNKNGAMEWQKELGKKARDSAFHSAAATTDGFFLAGRANGRPGGVLESSAAWLVKLDRQGMVLWDKSIILDDVAIAIDVKAIGTTGAIVAGRLRHHIQNINQDSAWVMNIDNKGSILWKKVLQTRYEAWADTVVQRHNGGFFVAGRSRPKFNHNGADVWLAQLDESGNMLWEKSIESQGNEHATVLHELADGAVILGAERSEAGKESVWLIKLKADGAVVWEKKIADHGFCSIGGLRTTKSGEVLALGKTCVDSKEQIWAAVFSATGDLKESRKFGKSGVDSLSVDSAIEALNYLRRLYPNSETLMFEVKL